MLNSGELVMSVAWFRCCWTDLALHHSPEHCPAVMRAAWRTSYALICQSVPVSVQPARCTGADVIKLECSRVRCGRLNYNLAAAKERGVEVPMVAAYRKMFNISRGSPVMLANAVLPTALRPLVAWLAAALRDQSLVSHEVGTSPVAALYLLGVLSF